MKLDLSKRRVRGWTVVKPALVDDPTIANVYLVRCPSGRVIGASRYQIVHHKLPVCDCIGCARRREMREFNSLPTWTRAMRIAEVMMSA